MKSMMNTRIWTLKVKDHDIIIITETYVNEYTGKSIMYQEYFYVSYNPIRPNYKQLYEFHIAEDTQSIPTKRLNNILNNKHKEKKGTILIRWEK